MHTWGWGPGLPGCRESRGTCWAVCFPTPGLRYPCPLGLCGQGPPSPPPEHLLGTSGSPHHTLEGRLLGPNPMGPCCFYQMLLSTPGLSRLLSLHWEEGEAMVSAISSCHLPTPLVAKLWSIQPSSETQVRPLGSLSGKLGHWTCRPTPGRSQAFRGVLSDCMLLCWG